MLYTTPTDAAWETISPLPRRNTLLLLHEWKPCTHSNCRSAEGGWTGGDDGEAGGTRARCHGRMLAAPSNSPTSSIAKARLEAGTQS